MAMDNASHAARTSPCPSERLQVGLDTNIYPQCHLSWGSSAEEKKWDRNSTKQLCLGKETIYQNRAVIYASLSPANPTVRVSSLLQLFSEIYHGPPTPGQKTDLQLVHRQLGRPLDTPGCWLCLLCLEKAEQHGQIRRR